MNNQQSILFIRLHAIKTHSFFKAYSVAKYIIAAAIIMIIVAITMFFTINLTTILHMTIIADATITVIIFFHADFFSSFIPAAFYSTANTTNSAIAVVNAAPSC